MEPLWGWRDEMAGLPEEPPSRWTRFIWWLGDFGHWAGWTADPAEVETATAWLSLHWIQVTVWRRGRTDIRDRARLCLVRLPLHFRVCVAAMWR